MTAARRTLRNLSLLLLACLLCLLLGWQVCERANRKQEDRLHLGYTFLTELETYHVYLTQAQRSLAEDPTGAWFRTLAGGVASDPQAQLEWPPAHGTTWALSPKLSRFLEGLYAQFLTLGNAHLQDAPHLQETRARTQRYCDTGQAVYAYLCAQWHSYPGQPLKTSREWVQPLGDNLYENLYRTPEEERPRFLDDEYDSIREQVEALIPDALAPSS